MAPGGHIPDGHRRFAFFRRLCRFCLNELRAAIAFFPAACYNFQRS